VLSREPGVGAAESSRECLCNATSTWASPFSFRSGGALVTRNMDIYGAHTRHRYGEASCVVSSYVYTPCVVPAIIYYK